MLGWKTQFFNFNEWAYKSPKKSLIYVKKLHLNAQSNVKEGH